MNEKFYTKKEIEIALKDPRRYSLDKRIDNRNKKNFEKSLNNIIKWGFVYVIYLLFEIIFTILRFKNRFNKNLDDINKIIVFKLEHIGDVILSTPVYREIKKNYPKSKLYVVTTPNIEDTLENNPNIDQIMHINPGFTNRLLDKFKINERIKIDLENFKTVLKIMLFVRPDIAISLRNDYGNIFLNYFSGARIRIGHLMTPYDYLLTHPVNYNRDLHEVERNLQLLEQINIKNKDKSLELFPNNKKTKFAEKFLDDNLIKKTDILVGIHIGGSGNLKWWPIEKFISITDYLIKKYDAKIVILGKGNDEEKEADALSKKFDRKVIKSFDSSVLEKAAIIDKCRLLICNDSAPMHIGAAMKTPMIAMFGPGNYKYYKPLEKIHTVIYKHLKCSPCAPFVQNEKNDCPENICMKLIKTEEVIKEINRKLK